MTVTDQTTPFVPKEALLTADQVAEWTGLTTGALAQLRYKGTGPRYRRLNGKTIRYTEQDVRRWLDDIARTSTATH